MKKLQKEELDLLSYQDIAELVLRDSKKKSTTIDLFTEVSKQIGLSDEELKERVGDFYTGLTIDQRFIILPDGKWDLRENHTVDIVVEDEPEETEENFGEEDEDDSEEEVEEDNLDAQPDDDFEEDELEDLVIVEEEDLSEN